MRSVRMRVAQLASRILVSGALVALAACGSASSNNQGTGFLAYATIDPTRLTGTINPCSTQGIPVLTGLSVPITGGIGTGSSLAESGSGLAFGGAVQVAAGVQNNITTVGMRTERVDITYTVPGSSVNLPSTSVPLGLVVGPSQVTNTTDDFVVAESSLPGGFTNLCNRGIGTFEILPSDIREYIAFNKASLPQVPFVINASYTVTAVSTAGDVFETNALTLPIEIVSDVSIAPTSGLDDTANSTSELNDLSDIL